MSCADAGSSPVRRFEVFTGAGGRRSWTREEKAAIVAESKRCSHGGPYDPDNIDELITKRRVAAIAIRRAAGKAAYAKRRA